MIFKPFYSDWSNIAEAAPQTGTAPLAQMPAPAMTTQGVPVLGAGATGISAQPSPAIPTTDWGNIAGAGIGAAGATAGTIAQLAGQKAALDAQLAAQAANNTSSMKLAKLQLGQQASQFDKTQAMKALVWALDANNAKKNTGNAGRDLRRNDAQLMSDIMAKIYLRH